MELDFGYLRDKCISNRRFRISLEQKDKIRRKVAKTMIHFLAVVITAVLIYSVPIGWYF